MPAASPQSTKQDRAISEPKSPIDLVSSLTTVLHQYTSGDDFKSLSETRKEVDTLRKQNASVQTAYETNLATLYKTTSDFEKKEIHHAQALDAQTKSLDDAIKARKRIEEKAAETQTALASKVTEVGNLDREVQRLIKQVKEGEARVNVLQDVERQRDALRDELNTATERLETQAQELAEVSEGLEMIRSCVVPLSTIHDNGEFIRKELRSIVDRAYQPMSKWLSRNLEDGYLNDPKLWKAIRSHLSIPRDLPLPNTNSHTAKNMRIAASLRVFAYALSRHVLRPTYIVPEKSIDDALAELADYDTNQNVYVRAALLKVLPEKQRQGREDGIRMAVEEVVDAVAGWIPQADVQEFRSELGAVTHKIAESWSHVQKLEELVRPSLEREYQQDWKPLPTRRAMGPVGANTAPTQPNNAKQRGKQDGANQARQADEAVAIPIWPVFLHAAAGRGGEAHALVFHGFGLTTSQKAEAEEEEKSSRGSQKLAREPGPPPSPRQRRDSGVSSFLGKVISGSGAG